jgi:hypothetical protein
VQGIIRGKSVDARVVERAAVGILRLCQRLLPYKPDVAEPLLRGLQVGVTGLAGWLVAVHGCMLPGPSASSTGDGLLL